MRIAVCDDQLQELQHILTLLEKYETERSAGLSVRSFQNANGLLWDIKGGEYDVIFLEVMMLGLGGIQAVRELREIDQNVRIIVLTSSPDFAVESYGVGAYHYILKPATTKMLFPLLDKLCREMENQEEEALLLKSREGLLKIPFSRLEYVEVMNKSVYFHLSDGSVREIKASLSEFEQELLSRPEFLKSHRSYLMNLHQIESVNAKEALTKTGHSIPVARSFYAGVKEAYLRLLFQAQAEELPVAPADKAPIDCPQSGPWRILLVDDEPEALSAWSQRLLDHGCLVELAENGTRALALSAASDFDCVLLDVMLPGEDGFALCSRLMKQTGAPVIFLSSLTDAEKQLQGFRVGGIDYITKDTPADLFWAKVEARVRLARTGRTQLSFAPMLLDYARRRVTIDEQELLLTSTEFDLLWLLAEHSLHVFSPEDLYRSVWGSRQWDGGQTVQVHMSRLRRKLEKAYTGHYFLETVWGEGYRFVPVSKGGGCG